ncbi:(Fe-S)-binding protein [Blastococcus brunescens]|uniref:(Fe-S)-binding protein n=1 Tax=Blastococcus brunescens TaxID=1564165 RepID=A0ABZ1AXR7_9ACTN|nr:(Fe-S)-binding protein [Blastococcus sp. BMG 8361]WRL63358.1 (Fe-S)-binding protein [Blastococcus sp. BMG 8361]
MTGPLQIVLGTISVLFLIVSSVLAYRAVRAMVRIIRTGQPDGTRFGPVKSRLKTLAIESLGHTRMLKWSAIGAAHWFVFVGFYGLFLTLVEAFGEVWNPAFHLPLIGEWSLWNLFADIIGTGTILGILYLIYRRQKDHPRRQGRKSRFAGTNEGRGYFVEAVVLTVGVAILLIRALKVSSDLTDAPAWSHPISGALAAILPDSPDLLTVVAFVKIVVSLTWLVVISRILNMGVAWHRFSAFFNIYFKREDDGTVALGPLQPMTSGGKPIDFEDPGEDDVFGRGKIEDFTWKGMLDFTTCTECGRCQSQCPAWNTGKPLSPKMVIMDLRDHLYAKAPTCSARRRRPRRRRTTTSSSPPTSRPGRRATPASRGPTTRRRTGRWSARSRRAGSSTPTSCGAARAAAPAWSSARSTSSTSTTSWTCAATRC